MPKPNITSIDIAFVILLVISLSIVSYSAVNENAPKDINSKELVIKLNADSASYSIKEVINCEGSSILTKISDRCFVKVLKSSSNVKKQNFSKKVAEDLLTLSDHLESKA